MNWTDLRLRLRALIFHKRVESELQEEIDFHLEMQKRKNLQTGMPAAEAKRRAFTKFGSVQSIAEECRDARGLNFVDSVIQDIRYACRQFRRSRVFTLVAILSLSLGIGANTALFTVFDALYLRKLPVSEPDDIASFRWRAFGESNRFVPNGRVMGSLMTSSDGDTGVEYTASTSFLPATLSEFRRAAGIPAEVFGFSPFGANVDIRGSPNEVSAQLVSGNYFRILGVSMVAGRPLDNSDDDPSAEPAVVISDFVWDRLFARDRSTIGEKIAINGLPVTIVGVTPPDFYVAGGASPGLSLPMAFASRMSQGALQQPGLWWLRIMARKAPEATMQQVQESLQGVFQASILSGTEVSSDALPKEQIPRLEVWAANRGFVEIASSGRQEVFLLTVSAVFGLLLLIVCVNLANLLTARAVAREYEIGMRLALGAGRRRLIRQLLTESVVLAFAGGVLGVLAAHWGKELLKTYLGEQIVLSINPRVLAFSIAVAAIAGVLFGLAPALRATRSNLHDAAKGNIRNVAPRALLNKSLVIIQVAMSVVLLTGAGLLVRTLNNWQRMDMGFNVDGLVIFELPPVGQNQKDADFNRRLTERIGAVPGVVAVTTAGCFPPSSCGNVVRATEGNAPSTEARRLMIGPSFFATFGISVLAGRNVDGRDVPGAPAVAVVDDALARQLYPDANPIGKRFSVGRMPESREFEIVGIVQNIVLDVGRSKIRPVYYTPESQVTSDSGTGFIVRTSGDPQLVIPAIRRTVADINPRSGTASPTVGYLDVVRRNCPASHGHWFIRAHGVHGVTPR
jgi:predicted permease